MLCRRLKRIRFGRPRLWACSCPRTTSTEEWASEGGVILRELEHPDGARIALERGGAVSPFAITCGIYGWMVHTS